MSTIFARKALLAGGWAANVRLDVADGRIAGVVLDADAAGCDAELGILIPGLTNAHSHAFQRALAGHTEERAPASKDNFWTWRSRMYELSAKIDSDALEVIARQVYGEMVATGYTSVAEFHYLHNEPDSRQITESMFEALAAAADASGIRLTYVPVLYQRAGFEQPDPAPEQLRFATSLDDYLQHYERVKKLAGNRHRVGMGAHSLRAVTRESLATIVARAVEDAAPFHIHIAEQQREVEQCMHAYGARPIEWLLGEHAVDERWCLVHATHMTDNEITAVGGCGAVVCLCPSTEANLGDGLFPLQRYLETGGRIAIGSDSHVSINPFEELRWLEYGQRLVEQRRNVAAIRRPQTGRSLFELAADGGARAAAIQSGRIEKGADADLIALDDDSPMLVGHSTRSLLDALVFSGFTLPIDRVMVRGEWRVIEGRHDDALEANRAYAKVARSLFESEATA
ncbi:MAG: formimidoylglutamate deiminase [Woeseiaceae bacterium]|nr:formimidoylglutamate deiminase [Woeseiaceae bacterium]